jgi:hypothetical protein
MLTNIVYTKTILVFIFFLTIMSRKIEGNAYSKIASLSLATTIFRIEIVTND